MSKQLMRTVFLVGVVFSLAACSKKPSAQEAVEAFVNTEFYLTDFAEYEKAFGQKVAKDSENLVKNDLEKELTAYGIEATDSQAVADAMLKAIVDKTSVTARTLTEDKVKATVELTVKGIDMNQFQVDIERNLEEKLLSLMNQGGLEKIKTLDDLQKLTFEADVEIAQAITDNFSKDSKEITKVIQKAIKEMKIVETESKVTVDLIENNEQKKFWVIQDETALIDKLTNALMI